VNILTTQSNSVNATTASIKGNSFLSFKCLHVFKQNNTLQILSLGQTNHAARAYLLRLRSVCKKYKTKTKKPCPSFHANLQVCFPVPAGKNPRRMYFTQYFLSSCNKLQC